MNVLYVDDDIINLFIFKFKFNNDFNVFITSDLYDAIEIIENNDIHIVVCDLKMPVSGIDFLTRLTEVKSGIVKILLTSYVDVTDLISAINIAHVYYYIQKPFDYEHLKSKILDSYEYYKFINGITT